MRFIETELPGAFIVEIEPKGDERGFFARIFDAKLFEEHGMNPAIPQMNMASSKTKGTLRGMHYQVEPALESKFVRCLSGAVHDVVVDLRPDSPTYMRHISVELSAENRRALYIPGLFGHGYQTLEDDTDVLYQVGEWYTPSAEAGLRYDDPALGIEWPLEVTVISEKDRAWKLLDEQPAEAR